MPRILFINMGYYLSREIPSALTKLQCPFLNFQPGRLPDGRDCELFLPRLLKAIAQYKPHMVLTVNGLGLDKDGVVAEFLNTAGIPLVVWFVDNPELFCLGCESSYPDKTIFFTCDPDGPAKVRRWVPCVTHVLPLAADTNTFKPVTTTHARKVSFAGDTWTGKIAVCHKNHFFPRVLVRQALGVARALVDQQPGDGIGFIQTRFPDIYKQALTLPPNGQNGFWHLVYWQANRLYRINCVEKILPFRPLIVGDRYWKRLLPEEHFEAHPPVAYGEEVFRLYGMSAINFACSSMQMAGAVTQRVFDVPASGGFVLTDARRQLDDLFDRGKEVVCFDSTDEIGPLIQRYLEDEGKRRNIIKAARMRIASEHTYVHRMQTLIQMVNASL
ncbi:CgeB family protein [Desulfoplanes formicivorans]|uniref:Spore protein YkvP/CgeB glycosyl transferase-like domain-containing protein n=1 Tax=Desulfoplanes formicivorans TaxID=1592317 RepID=A0A194AK07_9BACT|nr:glycosyltransferase [Desulfoplanes formicivorans]GAU09391.1 hypothetical protein DPF_2117 [Desulfoplanes formicivorans]